MLTAVAWLGACVSIVSLLANLYQWYAQSIAKGAMDLHQDQLLAIKTSLRLLLAQLNEAGERRTAIKSEGAVEWLGTVGHKVKMIECQVDIMLGLIQLPTKPLSCLGRFWAKLFPLAVRYETDVAAWQASEEKRAKDAGPKAAQ